MVPGTVAAEQGGINFINGSNWIINYRVRARLGKVVRMNTTPGMNARSLWSRILVIVGSIAMLVGALDPMEGSVVILPGSGLVALGPSSVKANAG